MSHRSDTKLTKTMRDVVRGVLGSAPSGNQATAYLTRSALGMSHHNLLCQGSSAILTHDLQIDTKTSVLSLTLDFSLNLTQIDGGH